jgi:hypothetical protein
VLGPWRRSNFSRLSQQERSSAIFYDDFTQIFFCLSLAGSLFVMCCRNEQSMGQKKLRQNAGYEAKRIGCKVAEQVKFSPGTPQMKKQRYD